MEETGLVTVPKSIGVFDFMPPALHEVQHTSYQDFDQQIGHVLPTVLFAADWLKASGYSCGYLSIAYCCRADLRYYRYRRLYNFVVATSYLGCNNAIAAAID